MAGTDGQPAAKEHPQNTEGPQHRGAGDPAQVASAPFSPLPDGRREEGRKGGVCEIELVENSLLFDVFSSLIVETNDPFRQALSPVPASPFLDKLRL